MATSGYQLGAVLALAAASFVALPARSSEPGEGVEASAPTAFDLSEEARTRYDQGDYERALTLFTRAYAREADPNLLFNIARCYEKLGELERALEKYEVFLSSPNSDPEGRQKAEASRAEIQKAFSRQRRAERADVRGEPATRTDAGGSAVDTASSGPGLAPWLLLGAGVAVLASGAVVYSLGVSDHNRVEEQAGFGDSRGVVPMTQREAEAHVESGNDKKLVGGLLLGGGGAMVASSALLFLLVNRDEPPSRVGLELSPRGASVALRGRF